MNETLHREVIEIDFTTDKGRAKLQELQAAGEALLKMWSQPVPLALNPMGHPGLSTSASAGTMSSTAVLTQQQASTHASTFSSGATAHESSERVSHPSTRSSGAAASQTPSAGLSPISQTAPSASASSSAAFSPASSTQGAPSQAGLLEQAFHSSARASLMALSAGPQGAVQGVTHLAGQAIGGKAGGVVGMLGSISGLGDLSDANAFRASIDSGLGMAALSGQIQASGLTQQALKLGVKDPGLITNLLLDHAKGLNVSPTQLVEGSQEYLRAVGGTFTSDGPLKQASEWVSAMGLSQISPGTMGALDSQVMLHGASGDNFSATRLAGAGSWGFGLAGGLDRWLQQLSSQLERLSSRGLQIDMSGMAHFLERMAADSTLRHLGGKAPAVLGSLGGVAADARSQLLSPFQGLSQSAVMLEAFSGGRSYHEALTFMEKMGPGGVLGATKKHFGDLGPEALSAITSMTMDQSRALLGMPEEGMAPRGPRRIESYWHARAYAQNFKEYDRAVNKPGSVQEHWNMVKAETTLDDVSNWVSKKLTGVVGAFQDEVTELIGGLRALSHQLNDYRTPKPSVERD